jgi:valyl-tRNA synthetase
MYSFFLYDFCDIYLEATKARSTSHFPNYCSCFSHPRPRAYFPLPPTRPLPHLPSLQLAHVCGCALTSPPPNFTTASRYHFLFIPCRSLKLMHPLMPFVTEELWNRIPHLASEAPTLMIASYAPASTVPALLSPSNSCIHRPCTSFPPTSSEPLSLSRSSSQ